MIVGRITFVMSQLSNTPYGFLPSYIGVRLAGGFTAHEGVSSTVIYSCDTKGREKQWVFQNTNRAIAFPHDFIPTQGFALYHLLHWKRPF